MTTAKDYQASFGKRKPNPDEAAELYRLREQDVQAIAAKPLITVADIQTLEWGGRFMIANEFFDKCDEQARYALLHDQHNGVRSAATLFKPAVTSAPPIPPVASKPATQATVREIAAAIMNGKPHLDTLHGVKTASGIEEMIASTHPTALLERAEAFIVGFEGDDMQEGVDQLLADLRASLKPIR
jgi:hypothetical protein